MTTAVDASGNGHDGTYQGSPINAAGLVTGSADTAVSLNPATNDCAVQNGTIGAQTFSAFTIGLLIKPTTTGDANNPSVWGITSAGVSATDEILIAQRSDGKLDFFGGSSAGVNGGFSSATVLNAGTVYRVICTWDGTTAKIYINGSVDATTSWTHAVDLTNVEQFVLGTDIQDLTGNVSFHGVLDEAFFVRNHAATTGEIATIDAAWTGTGSAQAAVLALSPFIFWRLDDLSGGGGGGGGTVVPCIEVDIDNFTMDNVTQDSNGVVYDWQDLAGWFDSGDLTIQTAQRPVGVLETATNLGGRTITVTGIAHLPNPTAVLGTKAWAAMRYIKAQTDAVFGPRTLYVYESPVALQALVRQNGPVRMKLLQSVLGVVAVTFQIPLLAPDPRRYSQTLTTNTALSIGGGSTTNDQAFTNLGDTDTPFAAFIQGDADQPYIQSLTLTGTPFVRANVSMTGTDLLIIDMARLTATLNGLDVTTLLYGNPNPPFPPKWWNLPSGVSNVRLGRGSSSGTLSASVGYRAAYL